MEEEELTCWHAIALAAASLPAAKAKGDNSSLCKELIANNVVVQVVAAAR